jgi:hypothetical protein
MLKTGDAVNGTDTSGVSQPADFGTNVIALPGIATTGSIPALAPSSDAGSDYLEQSALIAGGGAATISPSSPPSFIGFDAAGFDASGLTAASSAIAGVITLKPDPGPPTTSADKGGATTDIVTTAGSGMVFNNTFESSVSSAYKNAAITAEQTIAGLFTDNITINEDFKAVASGQNGKTGTSRAIASAFSVSAIRS